MEPSTFILALPPAFRFFFAFLLLLLLFFFLLYLACALGTVHKYKQRTFLPGKPKTNEIKKKNRMREAAEKKRNKGTHNWNQNDRMAGWRWQCVGVSYHFCLVVWIYIYIHSMIRFKLPHSFSPCLLTRLTFAYLVFFLLGFSHTYSELLIFFFFSKIVMPFHLRVPPKMPLCSSKRCY